MKGWAEFSITTQGGPPRRSAEFWHTTGFQATYADTGEPYDGHVCYVRSIRCWADEYRFGGIVIEVQDSEPNPS